MENKENTQERQLEQDLRRLMSLLKCFLLGVTQPNEKFKEISVNGNLWENEPEDGNSTKMITFKSNDNNIFHPKVGDEYGFGSKCFKFYN